MSREALKDLDVRLITFGPYIESQDFWIGLDVVRGTDDDLERQTWSFFRLLWSIAQGDSFWRRHQEFPLLRQMPAVFRALLV